jgi:hypothetical protein
MTKSKTSKALRMAFAMSMPLQFSSATLLVPTAVTAGTLPSPYVARA